MKITAVELYHVSVPLKETFWPIWIPGYPQTHNRFTLVKLMTDEGIVGYSAGIGFYINWNMVLADPDNALSLEYPLEEPAWVPEAREGITAPILPDSNGMLHPFTRPGLGFEIDQGLLKRYGKRFFKATETRLKLKVIREKGFKTALALKRRKEDHLGVS